MGAGPASERPAGRLGEGRIALVAGALALALVLVVLGVSGLRAPGMYYDEAWFAGEARRFLEPTRQGQMPPGAESVSLSNRPFPVFSAPYLGALKSQWLIPWLALFGARPETVRLATLGAALCALFATLFATRRIFGTPTALLAGALVAFDPTVFFHAQWEWGPFTTGWLCRALGAALLLRSAQEGGRASAFGGALLLGLSVYNRIDSVLVIGAVVLGVALFQRRDLGALVRSRRADVVTALAGFSLGALPMLLNAPRVLGTFGALRGRGDFSERLRTLLATLDGSYVHRLMEQGGRFEALHEASAPLALLGAAWCTALVGSALAAWRARGRAGASLADGRAALGVACVVLAASLLALRGATRAHHMLNLAPLVHVFVAASIVALACSGPRARWLAVSAALAILASDARSITQTRELVARSGGRGWWSDALSGLASELEGEPGSVVVSLDWGFHLPLLFETTTPALAEPIWQIASEARRTGAWRMAGTSAHHYLVHEAPWDRFGFGPLFLSAARALGGRAEVRAWRDREGQVAFYSVRFAAPHRVTFQHGRGFQIELGRALAGERGSP